VSTIVRALAGGNPPANRNQPDAVEAFVLPPLTADLYEIKHADLDAAAITVPIALAQAKADASFYLGILRPAVPNYTWSTGTTLWPGIRLWPGFRGGPQGYTLTTFNTTMIVGGSILYDFIPNRIANWVAELGQAFLFHAILADVAAKVMELMMEKIWGFLSVERFRPIAVDMVEAEDAKLRTGSESSRKKRPRRLLGNQWGLDEGNCE